MLRFHPRSHRLCERECAKVQATSTICVRAASPWCPLNFVREVRERLKPLASYDAARLIDRLLLPSPPSRPGRPRSRVASAFLPQPRHESPRRAGGKRTPGITCHARASGCLQIKEHDRVSTTIVTLMVAPRCDTICQSWSSVRIDAGFSKGIPFVVLSHGRMAFRVAEASRLRRPRCCRDRVACRLQAMLDLLGVPRSGGPFDMGVLAQTSRDFPEGPVPRSPLMAACRGKPSPCVILQTSASIRVGGRLHRSVDAGVPCASPGSAGSVARTGLLRHERHRGNVTMPTSFSAISRAAFMGGGRPLIAPPDPPSTVLPPRSICRGWQPPPDLPDDQFLRCGWPSGWMTLRAAASIRGGLRCLIWRCGGLPPSKSRANWKSTHHRTNRASVLSAWGMLTSDFLY